MLDFVAGIDVLLEVVEGVEGQLRRLPWLLSWQLMGCEFRGKVIVRVEGVDGILVEELVAVAEAVISGVMEFV